MTSSRFSQIVGLIAVVMTCVVVSPPVVAQGPVPDAPAPLVQPAPLAIVAPASATVEHRFWDKENVMLFSVSGALSAADFAVTRANLQSGGTEFNPLVRMFGRSTAGLIMNFASENLGAMGFSYFFHKTGHHKLERAVSMVNIGASAGAVSFGLTHR